MEKFSLLHPTNSNASYRTLNKEALNDLSVDYICDALTKEQYERNSIKQLLINITDDEENEIYANAVRYSFAKNKIKKQLMEVQ